ncbi:MAG: right-handed parallel beta-helix repeat-containing protein, partial [Bacteroidia bacterium]|nr:right-handed parallel beta-helix repeat-containing protein [Bacteroidia bacterium]
MKNIYLSFILILFFSVNLNSQTIYVDGEAMGANDGTSWSNAYNSLDDALADSTGNMIWIAAGIYVPGGSMADTSSTFLVDKAIDIYGGFAGTESDPTQRNIEQNPTILSGDILQNDNGSMEAALRIDNVRHVMFIQADLGRVININGLIVEGGQTSDDADHVYLNRAGAGIYTNNAVHVSDCTFRNNFGRSGGGLLIDNPGSIVDPVSVTNCVFHDNLATAQSAGLLMLSLDNVTVDNCVFEDNTTNRGALYPVECNVVNIKNTNFVNNNNPSGFGGAMFSWQNQHLTIEGCTFRNNASVQSGCMYYDAREIAFGDPSLTIRDCVFNNNTATDGFSGGFTLWQGTNILIDGCEFNRNVANSGGCLLYNGTESPPMNPDNFIMKNCEFGTNEAIDFGGGGCYFSGASFTIDSCTFLGNIGTNSGGALFITGDNKEYLIQNCFFGLNNGNYGGAMANYGDNSNGTIRNCEFLTNTAGVGGGAMNCGFKINLLIDDCMFRGGTANVGGAISAQNDSTTITVMNSVIAGNTGNNNGGGFFTFTGDLSLNFINTEIYDNTSDFGGGLSLGGDINIDTSFFTIDRCMIYNNIATTQAGGININDKSGVIRNSLLYGNIAEGVGTGGAISVNSAGDTNIEVDILNTTMTGNLGLLSSGIAAWTDSVATAEVRLQNTLLDNNNDYEIEDGSPEFISMGGNFSSDPFMDQLFNDDDIIDVDP